MITHCGSTWQPFNYHKLRNFLEKKLNRTQNLDANRFDRWHKAYSDKNSHLKKDQKNQITIIKGIETNRDESITGDEEFLLVMKIMLYFILFYVEWTAYIIILIFWVGYLREVVIENKVGASGNAVRRCCAILRGMVRWLTEDPSCFECWAVGWTVQQRRGSVAGLSSGTKFCGWRSLR